jgi:polyhydroxybutyrate depolymerase
MKNSSILMAFFIVGCTSGKSSDDTSIQNDTEAPIDDVISDSLLSGVNEFTIDQEVDGEVVLRRFLVHTSDNFDDTVRVPLLFAFHGNGGVADSFTGQLSPSIQDGTFIGVYPDGISNSWNLGREESTADDVAFVESILNALDGIDGVNTEKPVAMGFSNGAGMVHKLALNSEYFVGISPQASQLFTHDTPKEDDVPVSVLQFHGTEDDVVPYDGGEAVMGHNFLPAEESGELWAAHNGCDSTPTETVSGDHLKFEWGNCSSGKRVVHFRLNGVGHELPPNIEGGTIQYVVDFLSEARE